MSSYNLKFIQSGNRLEVYRYSIPQTLGESNNNAGRKGKSDKPKKTEKNRREVLYKARNNIIRLANCNPDLCTFITLTYANKMQDIKQSKADLANSIKLLRKFWPDIKYLYVLEFQRRGAIHYHMLCNIPITIKTARNGKYKPEEQKELESYFHEVFWEHGWVDVRNLISEGNTNVGKYVSSYLVEDLLKLDLQGGRCYGYSRNLVKPTISTCSQICSLEDVIKEFYPWYDIKYISSYNMAHMSAFGPVNGVVNYMDMYER